MAVWAHWTGRALALAVALALGLADASAAAPASFQATSAEIAEAKRVLQANGYSDIAVLSSHDQMVTVSAMKGGKKSILDVDAMTGIVLPHMDMPPMRSQVTPVTGLPANPR